MKSAFVISPLLSLTMFISCAVQPPQPPQNAIGITAIAETQAVTTLDDAADDPAIWMHEEEIGLSRIIGTDKDFGVEVYSLRGEKLQSIAAGRTNNIDLRYMPRGSRWSALAAASNRSRNTISLFLIDEQGELLWLSDSEIATGLTEPYGLCMFANEAGLQVFVNDTDGRYQQWLLDLSGTEEQYPRIAGSLLREFAVPSQPEGCVADDEHQRLFVGVEDEGVRWLSAHHRAPATIGSVAEIDEEVLAADVEGMSLYTAGSRGYLVVSSQGNNSYAIYNRLPPFDYRGSVFVTGDTVTGIDGTSDTDGLDVSSALRTAQYPQGLLVVQDGANTDPIEPQNFKLISWQEVARALGL